MFLNENLGIMAMTGYSFLGGYTAEYKSPAGTSETEMNASYIPINIGLKLKAKMGNLSPYVYVAPGLYIPMVSGTYTSSGQTEETATYSFSPGIGFAAGIGAAFMISEKMGFKVEMAPTYAFASCTQIEYTQDGETMTVIFKNNTPVLPDDTATKSYVHGQPRLSFSSVALKAGISLGF